MVKIYSCCGSLRAISPIVIHRARFVEMPVIPSRQPPLIAPSPRFPCAAKPANRRGMSETLTLHAAFARDVGAALDALEAAGTLPSGLSRAAVAVEPPRDPAHGDLATNAAMVLA